MRFPFCCCCCDPQSAENSFRPSINRHEVSRKISHEIVKPEKKPVDAEEVAGPPMSTKQVTSQHSDNKHETDAAKQNAPSVIEEQPRATKKPQPGALAEIIKPLKPGAIAEINPETKVMKEIKQDLEGIKRKIDNSNQSTHEELKNLDNQLEQLLTKLNNRVKDTKLKEEKRIIMADIESCSSRIMELMKSSNPLSELQMAERELDQFDEKWEKAKSVISSEEFVAKEKLSKIRKDVESIKKKIRQSMPKIADALANLQFALDDLSSQNQQLNECKKILAKAINFYISFIEEQ